MIPEPLRVLGHEWHQAAVIARLLDISVDRVRKWGERRQVEVHHVPGRGRGTVWFRLDQCAQLEARARLLDAA